MKLRLVAMAAFPLTVGNHSITYQDVLLEYSISKLKLDPITDKAKTNCWLDNLYVPPDKRGKGLGHKVMWDFLKALKNGGIDAIALTAHPFGKGTNEQNLSKFYKSLGFKKWDEDYFTLTFNKKAWNELDSTNPNSGLKPSKPVKKVRKIEPKPVKVKNPLSGDEHLNQ